MAFPFYFVALWLGITTLLSLISGWYWLAWKFPNRREEPMLRLGWQSGGMRGVNMNGILWLSACPSGLRVGINRVFGPFCRSFFVPWESIAVERKTWLFWPIAKLTFGRPPVGSLAIDAYVANRLARAAAERWPERSFREETRRDLARRLVIVWAVTTGAAALFFIIVSRATTPNGPPIAVCILFPAVVFGGAMFVKYLRERG